jgi:glycosyltransferase involved in cell wall biosynthesis
VTATTGGPRVAMFVMNPCENDARVRKEAASLGHAGYEVRVFALGNSTWPAAVIEEDGFTIQRIEVLSRYQRIVRGVSGALVGGSRDETASPRHRSPVFAPLLLVAGIVALPFKVLWILLGRLVKLMRSLARRVLRAVDPGDPASARSVARRRAEKSRFPILYRWSASFARFVRGVLYRALRVVRVVYMKSRRKLRRVFILTRHWIRRTIRRSRRRLMLMTRKVLQTLLLPIHRPSVFAQFWKAAEREALDWGPDVLHAHDLNVLPPATRIAAEGGQPVVYDSHELWTRRNRHGLRPVARVFDRWQERRLIRQVALVITVSGSIADWLQDKYHLDERPMVLRNIPGAWDEIRGESLRTLAGANDEQQIVIYTGRITTGRGIEETIDALPELGGDVLLIMLGYGDPLYLEKLVARADRGGVADRVRVVGPVPSDQVSATASQADVALVAIQPICLSYRYSLPNKLFEAIQGGVPVIASDLPDISAFVTAHDVGRLFAPSDVAAFKSGLKEILEDSELFRRNAENLAQTLTWEAEAGQLIDAYRKLAEPSRRVVQYDS